MGYLKVEQVLVDATLATELDPIAGPLLETSVGALGGSTPAGFL
jgi:hypothetical protein